MENCKKAGRARRYIRSKAPRLQWTPQLHGCFLHAIDRLGGHQKATPKLLLQTMGVEGLKISHIKSHLQMYRSSKNAMKTDSQMIQGAFRYCCQDESELSAETSANYKFTSNSGSTHGTSWNHRWEEKTEDLVSKRTPWKDADDLDASVSCRRLQGDCESSNEPRRAPQEELIHMKNAFKLTGFIKSEMMEQRWFESMLNMSSSHTTGHGTKSKQVEEISKGELSFPSFTRWPSQSSTADTGDVMFSFQNKCRESTNGFTDERGISLDLTISIPGSY